MALWKHVLRSPGRVEVAGAPEGSDALLLARVAKERGGIMVHIARDAPRAAAMREALAFFAPEAPSVWFPAWDCLPYDRVSPSPDVLSRRISVLSLLAKRDPNDETPLIVVTSVNAVLQRVPPRDLLDKTAFTARPGEIVDSDQLMTYLADNGYARVGAVRDPGDFAVRGGLIDLFPPGAENPLRLDFFGDTLESVRAFDPETQLTIAQKPQIDLAPVGEALLTAETVSRFRTKYVAHFGAATDSDPLYEAISASRKYQGMEHWLPLFYEELATLFDYCGDDPMLFLDHLAEPAVEERFGSIKDYYEARRADRTDGGSSAFASPVYKPLEPDELYLSANAWRELLGSHALRAFSPFSAPDTSAYETGAKQGRSFAAERAAEGSNVFDAVAEHVDQLQRGGKRPFIACWSEGSAERMCAVLRDHGLPKLETLQEWPTANDASDPPGVIVLGLENGFETQDVAIIAEQDILGDRLVRRSKKRRAENFLREASSLSPGDLVVHVDHGIGRYDGLKTLEVQDAPHDCLQLVYAGGDKLFLPVENIELLSRYGSDDPSIQLDKLGGASWQARKSKMRERLKMMAEGLIKIAASREMKKTETLPAPEGTYAEFCARFPYAETEDQETAIEDVLEDLEKGRPMDRLVCGDVGFGKTEVALRAAFVAAMNGRQVALVAPTTLLARQHYKSFTERFSGFPLNIGRLSRLVPAAEATETREGLSEGRVDIVIGTHALLSKSIQFRDLGLLIVDEEQHFGVKHKERLKEYRSDTHVLTLTATPIPRTLQLAMSGIRDLSIIATPPVDRLAVRTTVGPFDSMIVRETLLREHYRGGQSFYVCPRITDLDEIANFLREDVPEVKFVIAHGQMAGGDLEDIMSAFYDGKYDVLVSTTIIESGLDIPTANTLVVHRADMFGLAQLYQIRGRVGRSKARAFALLTVPARKALTAGAEKRLKVLQSLDTLGAGFNLASHDLDIRGGGNLLGEEQSGHVKEVGVELYQHMLEEAVASLREGRMEELEEGWSPQINLGVAVLIPEDYVSDLDVRMALYRRLSELNDRAEIEGFAAELIDRFGPLPEEVGYLMEIVNIKSMCRHANVEKVDAGPKGAVVVHRNNIAPNPAGLVEYITSSPREMKIRPDQSLVFMQNWATPERRLKGARRLLELLVAIAEEAQPSAA